MSEKVMLNVRLDEKAEAELQLIQTRLGCDKSEAIRHALSVASQPPKPAPVNVSDGIKPEDILMLKKEKKFEPF
ncbi:hypothetical protein [Trichlorobacter lovleyi]|uniref:hypothetical protein n=1 Tax=Trichlorobacter lovleyi TaxID=313985 RepID=UPI0024806A6B|nr:hypothetical protein [Trichlorobacter lovleyi]